MSGSVQAAVRMEAMCGTLGVAMSAVHPDHPVMAARCARCSKGAACLIWRLNQIGVPETPPGYCLNAEAIEALSHAKGA